MSGILTAASQDVSAIVSLNPGDTIVSGGVGSTANFTETVNCLGSTPSAYSWTITNAVGTWAIVSGQGTATAQARLTGAAIGPDYTCTFNCAVTVNGRVYNVSANLDYARSS